MQEEWKDVKGYEGIYEVSSFGRVRSLDKTITRKDGKALFCMGKMLNPGIGSYGYRMVSLNNNGDHKAIALHRVVATAFIPNNSNLPSINHKDENKLNNNVENLEWCTIKYNDNYGTRNTRIAEKQSYFVRQYGKHGELIKEWNGVSTASRMLKLNFSHIASVCRKERNTCGGYIWRYSDEYYKNNSR